MVGNPNRWRAVIPQLENRNATAGCLLAVLFIVPFLAKTYRINFCILGLFVLTYVSIIVPVGTGIISRKYVIGRLRKLMTLVLDESKWHYYLTQMTYIASWLHFIYVRFEGIQIFMMQIVFNTAAEKVLCPDQRLSCLYVLLFYSFIAYLQRSLQTRPWIQLLNETSAKELIKMTTAFIILRLGKGVILSLVLFTLTIQFNHLEPSYGFVCITMVFFIFTQYQNNFRVKRFLIECLNRLELQFLDGIEDYWVPVLTNSLSIGLSAIMLIKLIFNTSNYIIMIVLGYINIFLPVCHSFIPAVKQLIEQREVISRYPLATWKNPQIRGGYCCAVCLDKLRILSSRCTPCGHVFHGACLRKCLQHCSRCPLCKTEIH